MSEYLLNNYRVFNAGNYLDETCAIATFISLLEGPYMDIRQPSVAPAS